jgi:hypothetical protein
MATIGINNDHEAKRDYIARTPRITIINILDNAPYFASLKFQDPLADFIAITNYFEGTTGLHSAPTFIASIAA